MWASKKFEMDLDKYNEGKIMNISRCDYFVHF